MPDPNLSKWLRNSNQVTFSVYVILAAFCTYSCMYAFRKPFTVATFEGLAYAGIDYKIWLITAQVCGYTLSKFAGIKVISEMSAQKRPLILLVLIAFAALALLGFATVPAPFNIIFLFVNGFPLGMIWGIVFSYLEGRKMTEVLGAGLSISFIFSSGFVKSIGKMVMNQWHTSELWMPFVTGILFLFPLFIFTYLLSKIPPPTVEDEAMRTKRAPMTKQERGRFLREYGPGLFLLISVYVLLTAFRDFRDNFAAELWSALGMGGSSTIFVLSEIPISLAVLVVMGCTVLIKNNVKALFFNHLLVAIGVVILGGSTYLYQLEIIDGSLWMILTGLGLYMGYIPFNTIFFERLIAASRHVGNVGFVIYLADSFGYLGSISVLFYKTFFAKELSWLQFFSNSSYMVMSCSVLFLCLSGIYFSIKFKKSMIPSELPTKDLPYSFN